MLRILTTWLSTVAFPHISVNLKAIASLTASTCPHMKFDKIPLKMSPLPFPRIKAISSRVDQPIPLAIPLAVVSLLGLSCTNFCHSHTYRQHSATWNNRATGGFTLDNHCKIMASNSYDATPIYNTEQSVWHFHSTPRTLNIALCNVDYIGSWPL